MSFLYSYEKKKISFAHSVLNLIGHLFGSGILFLSFIGVGWVISIFYHWLDGMHHFQQDVSIFITECELYLVYADAVLCGLVILVGAWRFIKELGEI